MFVVGEMALAVGMGSRKRRVRGRSVRVDRWGGKWGEGGRVRVGRAGKEGRRCGGRR